MAEGTLQAIQLLVDSETAKKLMKDGLAEIALRRKDKKFLSFIKAKIANSNVGEEAAKKLLNAVADSNAANGKFAAGIQKALKQIDLANIKLVNIDSSLTTISSKIEGVFRLSSKVMTLSFVNIGLAAANIAVDIAGFVYIANQMKHLGEGIDQIAAELDKIKDISVEDMRSECEGLSLDYNSFVTKIHDGDKLEREELEKYLKRAKPFISKLIRLLVKESVDAETLLNMIFTLLPAYTSVLCLFLRAYYFEKHTTPMNYSNFLEVYQEINDEQFKSKVQDYYLTGKQFEYRDVLDILNVQLLTVFNERLEIEDQLALIRTFNTDEEYFAFEKMLEDAVEREVAERAEEIAFCCGEYAEECRKVLLATA